MVLVVAAANQSLTIIPPLPIHLPHAIKIEVPFLGIKRPKRMVIQMVIVRVVITTTTTTTTGTTTTARRRALVGAIACFPKLRNGTEKTGVFC